jgi:exodeoxyribonuclease-3
MRIISYNVNGIRAAIKRGFIDWLKTDPADVICLQEVKAPKGDIDIAGIEAVGFHTHWFCAQKKGYSGVGILSKLKPDNIIEGCQMKQSDLKEGLSRLIFAMSL